LDPLLLGGLLAVFTIAVLFSGVSVANGPLIISVGFLIFFDGLRSRELMPEIIFGKLDNFALLSIPMFIIMGGSIASMRAGGTLGTLIPPSVTMIVYGIATETSIGRLFLAGVVLGLVLVSRFMV